ncbi:hypothetical protein [Helicobacter hepaticus]|uniref:hypothetical protein n=1 Tax=Helicobacter hepaticus TaxID=32025 RepID=UPI0039E0A891
MFILVNKAKCNLSFFFLRKYNILIECKASLDLIAKEYDNIKLWLTSQSFLEKYANHPYPPLLNPKKLDYTKIPAEVAWDLNLPLPPYYQFVFFGSHATGNRGLESFLRRCGGLNYCVQPPLLNGESWAKESYFCYFKQIMRNYHYTMPPPRYILAICLFENICLMINIKISFMPLSPKLMHFVSFETL